ncbi:MAG: hypothetical protein PHU23_09635 [Dehalococcoidales bacterium]|nr:hypothetical protein [Dehalococcoidales bacterium]
MTTQKLSEWIKTGYPYLKEEVGLAEWVLPKHLFNRAIDEVGDAGILKASRTLGLTDNLVHLMNEVSDPGSIPIADWQEAISKWPPLSEVGPVVAAFLQTQYRSLNSGFNPKIICRSLAVLLYAPFVDCGKKLLQEIALILDRPAADSAGLIRSYVEAVKKGDVQTLEKVNDSIVKYGAWRKWASVMGEQALKCRYTPKLIAVTPPNTPDLLSLLTNLIKERQDNGPSGNSKENPGKPPVTQ